MGNTFLRKWLFGRLEDNMLLPTGIMSKEQTEMFPEEATEIKQNKRSFHSTYLFPNRNTYISYLLRCYPSYFNGSFSCFACYFGCRHRKH